MSSLIISTSDIGGGAAVAVLQAGWPCCAREPAQPLEPAEPNLKVANQEYAALHAYSNKMIRRVARLSLELPQIQDTSAWRCLRWLFKLERSVRSAIKR